MKALALVLLLVTPAYAFDPLHPGLPVCEGGEQGYWQTITEKKADDRLVSHLALTSIDFLDPAYVICWVDPSQIVTAGERKPSTPIKRESSRKDRTIGALHELYAER
jgi:hypothetical protein